MSDAIFYGLLAVVCLVIGVVMPLLLDWMGVGRLLLRIMG